MKKLLAVTACPTGIAHTYMAAESLQKAADQKGVPIKVETRGAVGVENGLTAQEIAEAHAIIIAADTDVDEDRFAGKPVIRVAVAQGIKVPGELIDRALAKEASSGLAASPTATPEENAGRKPNMFYKHLMNGVSNMLPLVIAGGLIIAFSFLFAFTKGGVDQVEGSFGAALSTIGGASMGLMVIVLSGFISFSIAGKPGLAPGLVGGVLAKDMGAGFIGGIIAGFVAGYIAHYLIKTIKMPKNFEGLKPILIVPVLSVLAIGLLMVYVIGQPIEWLLTGLTAWLTNMGAGNAIILGAILGAMMALDMGGPFNKTAYTFAVGLLGASLYTPMAAVMAAGMTPPLGIWLATVIAKNRFTKEEREAGKVASILGLSFITEGAIPFGAADPIRVIPSFMVGSAVAGALSMYFGAGLHAPHGGVFVLFIPNAIDHLPQYVLSIVIGTVVTALMVLLLKRKAPAKL
ncbi:fructose-specific PTS transporter subunit EIIC [Paenibacillus sp. PsM32]|uniref:Fructose-specific PTS transporter subunit EIIC n=1 Tax=Paenibacillus kyungheensis TaxID=1452732 RepID=A0AAX3M678_9BACL|nr:MULTISPECIES: fructose-specific PTS transporter subunit EIIC [Paenibacillus]MDN4616803.1 fructose-specific PTS transporter subunit EIIC [Paenibacillus sp. PsM32]MDQ1233414.1 PTS system fructose-specific IIC component [Paenibacillus sp. SORGH_AS_0306]MDR6110454.1 PTS system fructose-specific IIC component [Paenibacillus sp. SORGH_AS_0338]WCT57348.1 fructose-specific PTS transporter subunit EIIC [Paenibacillus kyungheensis]WDF49551.1 fructose-specific PTS transporter subunit EIIC [Paenibacill